MLTPFRTFQVPALSRSTVAIKVGACAVRIQRENGELVFDGHLAIRPSLARSGDYVFNLGRANRYHVQTVRYRRMRDR